MPKKNLKKIPSRSTRTKQVSTKYKGFDKNGNFIITKRIGKMRNMTERGALLGNFYIQEVSHRRLNEWEHYYTYAFWGRNRRIPISNKVQSKIDHILNSIQEYFGRNANGHKKNIMTRKTTREHRNMVTTDFCLSSVGFVAIRNEPPSRDEILALAEGFQHILDMIEKENVH